MLKSVGILLVAAFIVFIEVPSLVEKKYKKELIVFSILLTIGVGLGVAHSLGKSIPNPIDLLTFIFKPVHDALIR
ncbi:hypothetical protein SAMN05518871_103277 [Psychrobacillus sp. OK028]|uniref:hypothetical protein n=1 Tax=Psychrobacillus sp. OK028 TaxID=1884359 RepID=UPI000880C25E|nr:hypothetical protein [Psychrobacillus sp. OK028]SDN09492.1 hypothetical protein SAMN05518871_103277 [Psychrobacillus sp. OK028]